MQMRRVLVSAAICCGLAVGPTVTFASSTHVVVARYSFAGTRSAVLHVKGQLRSSPDALLATAIVDVSNPRRPAVLLPNVFDFVSPPGVGSYGALGQRTICTLPLQCVVNGDELSFDFRYSVIGDGKHPLKLRV